MRKNWFILVFVLPLLALSVQAQAKPACVVMSKRIPPYLEAFEGFKEAFGGEVVRYDLDGAREKGGSIVGALMARDCAAIVPIGSLALDVVRPQISDRPIVYTMVAAPSAAVREARNVSGISIEPEADALFATLKRLMPNAVTIGIIYNPAYTAAYVAEATARAKAHALTLVARQAQDMREMAAVLDDLLSRVDVILMVPDPTTAQEKAFEYMLLESRRRGIPLIGLSAKHVRAGALFALASDYRATGRQTAELAQRVISGAVPSAQGARNEGERIVINAKTADHLGLHLPPEVLERAQEVYR